MSNNSIKNHNIINILKIPKYYDLFYTNFQISHTIFNKYEIYEKINTLLTKLYNLNIINNNTFYCNSFKWDCIFNDNYIEYIDSEAINTTITIQIWFSSNEEFILEYGCLCGDRMKAYKLYNKIKKLFKIN